MLITNEFEVAEPVDQVWQFFQNIPQVAACLPGAQLTEDLGDDKYKGTDAVRMGPVRLQFAGIADITERDEAAKRLTVHASGADEKGRGQASMVVTATLARAGRGTRVGVTQDLQLSGAARSSSHRSDIGHRAGRYFLLAELTPAFNWKSRARLQTAVKSATLSPTIGVDRRAHATRQLIDPFRIHRCNLRCSADSSSSGQSCATH